MKSRFKSLFSLSKKEIDWAFKRAKLVAKTRGLKLIQASGLFFEEQNGLGQTEQFGKLLIVTPRRSGKAHKRNLLRRRVKAIFYEKELFKHPVISILLVREDAMKLSFDEIQKFLVSNLS